MNKKDDQVDHAAQVPVLADGMRAWTRPWPSDIPAKDLYTGYDDVNPSGFGPGMGAITIPRHGRRPSPVPRNWPKSQPLPGAVNVGFFDGHAQAVKLDLLWQLYWGPYYIPPDKRPGL
jgi:prepilin-type processing-associated H-X9-DG protein